MKRRMRTTMMCQSFLSSTGEPPPSAPSSINVVCQTYHITIQNAISLSSNNIKCTTAKSTNMCTDDPTELIELKDRPVIEYEDSLIDFHAFLLGDIEENINTIL